MKTTRSRLKPEERKRHLLRSAVEAFVENGVDGTTMQQLAEHAGVSYGLYYHYFKSKEEVLSDAVEEFSVLPQIKQFLAAHDAPLREHLLRLPSVYFSVMEERREIVWLLFSESRKRPRLAERLSSLAEKFRLALFEYLKARQLEGEIPAERDLDVATRLIWSYLMMRLLWIENEPPAEDHLRLILDGLAG